MEEEKIFIPIQIIIENAEEAAMLANAEEYLRKAAAKAAAAKAKEEKLNAVREARAKLFNHYNWQKPKNPVVPLPKEDTMSQFTVTIAVKDAHGRAIEAIATITEGAKAGELIAKILSINTSVEIQTLMCRYSVGCKNPDCSYAHVVADGLIAESKELRNSSTYEERSAFQKKFLKVHAKYINDLVHKFGSVYFEYIAALKKPNTESGFTELVENFPMPKELDELEAALNSLRRDLAFRQAFKEKEIEDCKDREAKLHGIPDAKCKFGSRCNQKENPNHQYWHEDEKVALCKNMLSRPNGCTYNGCKFRHDDLSLEEESKIEEMRKKAPVCTFFKKGACKYGDSCTKLH